MSAPAAADVSAWPWAVDIDDPYADGSSLCPEPPDWLAELDGLPEVQLRRLVDVGAPEWTDREAGELRRLDPAGSTHDELVGQVELLERLKAAVEAEQLRALAVLDRRDATPQHYVREEVACALQIAPAAAATRLATARTTVDELPATWAALHAGRMTSRHAQHLCAAAWVVDPVTAGLVEEAVLGDVDTQTASMFARSVRRAVHRFDPHGAVRRHTAARRGRSVDLVALDDGMADLHVYGPAADLHAVYTEVDAAARCCPRGDERTLPQRRFDLLVSAALNGGAGLGGGAAPVRAGNTGAGGDVGAASSVGAPGDVGAASNVDAGDNGEFANTSADSAVSGGTTGRRPRDGLRPSICVTVAATTLLGLDDRPGELAGYGPIDADTARHIAADPTGTWRRILTDPVTEQVLDYGRRTYRPPQVLIDHVVVRDETCVFPGCRAPARRCDLDHVRPWLPDGTTSLDNLALLCRRHHNLKTDRRWSYELRFDGAIVWTSPTGRRYWSRPSNAVLEPADRPEDRPEDRLEDRLDDRPKDEAMLCDGDRSEDLAARSPHDLGADPPPF